MSSYARQFVEQIGRPKVDLINGISPTVAIEQRIHRGSKSQRWIYRKLPNAETLIRIEFGGSRQ